MLSGVVMERLEKAGSIWIYKGDPRKDMPHALLTSGRHSDGYVNVGKALKEQPEIRRWVAGRVYTAVRLKNGSVHANRVVGADTSSTALAQDLAKLIPGAEAIKMIKTENSGQKEQIWDPKNKPLKNGLIILQVEDLITTASSAIQVREGIKKANPGVKIEYFDYLPVIVDRPDHKNLTKMVGNSEILSLLRIDIRNYDPDQETCPYCAAGSEALEPKKNWKRFCP